MVTTAIRKGKKIRLDTIELDEVSVCIEVFDFCDSDMQASPNDTSEITFGYEVVGTVGEHRSHVACLS